MAKNKNTVYLGFEDEEITEKHRDTLDFTVNKVGGLPDWPQSKITVPNCPICNLSRPLLLQIYAPLENSKFHRTLYIFTCLNPSCSVLSKSWICIRIEVLDKGQESDAIAKMMPSLTMTWCKGEDDWDDPMEIRREENGNVIKTDNRNSDDEDDSNSTENEIVGDFVNLWVDEKNANIGAQGAAAAGVLTTNNIFAEIEGGESELVTIETPVMPERDLVALLKQTSRVPKLNNLTLKSSYILVDEERYDFSNSNGLSDHVRELIQEYQTKDENSRSGADSPLSSRTALGENDHEVYEKAVPAHGDVMFHNFITTIHRNPGQILRYSREAFPLLIAPLNEPIPICQNCGGECICELQILPTLIPKLRLENEESCPIEYGNVLIFTCLKSCWDTPDKMRIEHVIIQQEL